MKEWAIKTKTIFSLIRVSIVCLLNASDAVDTADSKRQKIERYDSFIKRPPHPRGRQFLFFVWPNESEVVRHHQQCMRTPLMDGSILAIVFFYSMNVYLAYR
jgi:hypothetical protein